jgi:roadblock/LC7 domain-containing protein
VSLTATLPQVCRGKRRSSSVALLHIPDPFALGSATDDSKLVEYFCQLREELVRHEVA